MLYTNPISFYNHQSCLFSDFLRQTLIMNTNESELNVDKKPPNEHLTSKGKRAMYMSQLRGASDSDYRRIERENNARAMRKRRLENPLYREQERRQNRTHMAEIRRDNATYRQREHTKNRLRMSLKRQFLSPTTPQPTSNNSIYQTLETNLQSSHISFVPYQSNFDYNQRKEYQLFRQIEDFCRQQDLGASSDSNSRSISSTLSQ